MLEIVLFKTNIDLETRLGLLFELVKKIIWQN
jgi:hypothetical protein